MIAAINDRAIEVFREPYPIGCIAHDVPSDVYDELVATWPPERLFRPMCGAKKLSLSEVNHPDAYAAFIGQHACWRRFHAVVKSPAYIEQALALGSMLLGRDLSQEAPRFSARFEFSAIPADGGFLAPHTDIPSKVMTFVQTMVRDGEWRQAWGGGTDILRPLIGDEAARGQDYKLPRSAFDVVRTFDFRPNQCVVFVKTDNSWHSVGPLTGPAGMYRRTLTINIERAA